MRKVKITFFLKNKQLNIAIDELQQHKDIMNVVMVGQTPCMFLYKYE